MFVCDPHLLWQIQHVLTQPCRCVKLPAFREEKGSSCMPSLVVVIIIQSDKISSKPAELGDCTSNNSSSNDCNDPKGGETIMEYFPCPSVFDVLRYLQSSSSARPVRLCSTWGNPVTSLLLCSRSLWGFAVFQLCAYVSKAFIIIVRSEEVKSDKCDGPLILWNLLELSFEDRKTSFTIKNITQKFDLPNFNVFTITFMVLHHKIYGKWIFFYI